MEGKEEMKKLFFFTSICAGLLFAGMSQVSALKVQVEGKGKVSEKIFDNSLRLQEVRGCVAYFEGVPVERLTLSYGGYKLEDEAITGATLLNDYGIGEIVASIVPAPPAEESIAPSPDPQSQVLVEIVPVPVAHIPVENEFGQVLSHVILLEGLEEIPEDSIVVDLIYGIRRKNCLGLGHEVEIFRKTAGREEKLPPGSEFWPLRELLSRHWQIKVKISSSVVKDIPPPPPPTKKTDEMITLAVNTFFVTPKVGGVLTAYKNFKFDFKMIKVHIPEHSGSNPMVLFVRENAEEFSVERLPSNVNARDAVEELVKRFKLGSEVLHIFCFNHAVGAFQKIEDDTPLESFQGKQLALGVSHPGSNGYISFSNGTKIVFPN